MNNIRIGFIGAGHVSNSMSNAIDNIEGIEKYAVASRDMNKAEKFAKDHNFKKSYGSYKEMLEDDNVELVYVATPVSYHYEHVRMSLEYGKHVLCEKTFTSNYQEAKELIDISKNKKLLLADAIWTRYMPSRYRIEEFLNSGIIGKPKMLEANLGYILNNKLRLFNKELGGGALYEIGIYPINLALSVLGNNFTVEYITKVFIDNIGKGSYIINSPETSKKEMNMLRLDSSLARKELGWKEKFNTEEAIKQTAIWYSEYLNKGDINNITEKQINNYIEG